MEEESQNLESNVEQEIEAPEVEETLSEGRKTGYIDTPEEYARVTGKPPETFRSKEEWESVGEYKKRLADQEAELRKWRETANNMAFMYKQMGEKNEAEVQRRLQELKEREFEAAAMGDVAQASEYRNSYDAEIVKVAQAKQLEEARQTEQAKAAFLERNKDWYDQSNTQMMSQVAILLERYAQQQGATAQSVLNNVEREMRAFYVAPVRAGVQSPHVSRTQSASNRTSAEVTGKLPASQREGYLTMKTFYDANGIKYTEQDHLAKLRQDGVL